jgi:glutaredoxin
MTIILYRTRLCPRCLMARKHLLALTRHRPDLIVEEREILRDLAATGRAGITMIPAIKIGDKVLSGIYLHRRRIENFLHQTGCL